MSQILCYDRSSRITGASKKDATLELSMIQQQKTCPIIPKPAELPDVYIDNNDGTITIPPPPPNTYNVTSEGETAIDNLNIPEDVKEEYKEVLESNNE